MAKLSLPLAAGVLAAGLAAQPGLSTKTHVGVFAKTGNAANYKLVAKGTKLTRPLAITASLPGVAAGTTASMKVQQSVIAVAIMEKALVSLRSGSASAGTSASGDPRNVVPGPHSFLLAIPGKKGSKASVILVYSGKVSGRSAASGAVDLDGDGKPDFAAKADGKTYRREFQIVAGERGFLITLTTVGIASQSGAGSAGYQGSLGLTFKPMGSGGRCTFTSFGTSCGPILRGTETQTPKGTVVTLTVTGAKPGVGILMMGPDRIRLLIPGTKCYLYTRPVLVLPHVASSTGKIVFNFLLPPAFAGKVVNQEGVVYRGLNRLHVETSNGLELVCTKG